MQISSIMLRDSFDACVYSSVCDSIHFKLVIPSPVMNRTYSQHDDCIKRDPLHWSYLVKSEGNFYM